MTEDWLSLSDVAKMLGVHPSTIRNWSDDGSFPVHRTQGGHRRFIRSEVDLWMQSQRADLSADVDSMIQNALRSVRLQIEEGRLQNETWYQKLDGASREQYRSSGRTLLHGLIKSIAEEEQSGDIEAESLGYEYAFRGWHHGLTCVEATHALLFFKKLLMESMFSVYQAAAVHSPLAWSKTFQKVNNYFDEILVALLETYESFQKAPK